MANDDWKVGAGIAAGAGIAGLIATGIYLWKKNQWNKERQQLQYRIRTLEGEILSQREYIQRLESRLERVQNIHLTRMNTVANEADAVIAEIEEIRKQVKQGTEFYEQLTSILTRARRVKGLGEQDRLYAVIS